PDFTAAATDILRKIGPEPGDLNILHVLNLLAFLDGLPNRGIVQSDINGFSDCWHESDGDANQNSPYRFHWTGHVRLRNVFYRENSSCFILRNAFLFCKRLPSSWLRC